MNKDDLISMAQEAGFCHDINNGIYLCAPMHIERFATLVAAAEREACAKVCEEFGKTPANMSQAWRNGCLESATEIRARGQE